MNKIMLIIYIILTLQLRPGEVKAMEKHAASSAAIHGDSIRNNDNRVMILHRYLNKYKSPLSAYSEVFVREADKYNIPWTLVASISGVESTFGKQIPYNSYNAWGWCNGNCAFHGWEEAISTVSKALRTNYFDRGIGDVQQIAGIYAPPSETWGNHVSYFMDQIEKYGNSSSSNLQISL